MLWLTTVFYPLLMVEPQNLLLKPLKLLQHLYPSTVLHNSRHQLQWSEKRNIKRSQLIQKRCKQILFKQLLKFPWVWHFVMPRKIFFLPFSSPMPTGSRSVKPPPSHIHTLPPIQTDFNLKALPFLITIIQFALLFLITIILRPYQSSHLEISFTSLAMGYGSFLVWVMCMKLLTL